MLLVVLVSNLALNNSQTSNQIEHDRVYEYATFTYVGMIEQISQYTSS